MRIASMTLTVVIAAAWAAAVPRAHHLAAERTWCCFGPRNFRMVPLYRGDVVFASQTPRNGTLDALRRASSQPRTIESMSSFSVDEVARLAGLARIRLSEGEIERMAGELDVIASAVAKVSEVATPDVPATSHPITLTNVMRADVVVPTLDRDEVLASAPASEDGKFLVPQILGEE